MNILGIPKNFWTWSESLAVWKIKNNEEVARKEIVNAEDNWQRISNSSALSVAQTAIVVNFAVGRDRDRWIWGYWAATVGTTRILLQLDAVFFSNQAIGHQTIWL